MARIGIQIGKVSSETGLSVDAIRFYERQRLLEPPRTEGGFRLFNPRDVRRIQFIQRAQGRGLSLPEIRELLDLQRADGEVCPQVRDLLRARPAPAPLPRRVWRAGGIRAVCPPRS